MGRTADRSKKPTKEQLLRRQRCFDYQEIDSDKDGGWNNLPAKHHEQVLDLFSQAEKGGIRVTSDRPNKTLFETEHWRIDFQRMTTASKGNGPVHYALALQNNRTKQSAASASWITVLVPVHLYNCSGPVTTTGIVGVFKGCLEARLAYGIACGDHPKDWLIGWKLSSPAERKKKEKAGLKPPFLSLSTQLEIIEESNKGMSTAKQHENEGAQVASVIPAAVSDSVKERRGWRILFGGKSKKGKNKV